MEFPITQEKIDIFTREYKNTLDVEIFKRLNDMFNPEKKQILYELESKIKLDIQKNKSNSYVRIHLANISNVVDMYAYEHLVHTVFKDHILEPFLKVNFPAATYTICSNGDVYLIFRINNLIAE